MVCLMTRPKKKKKKKSRRLGRIVRNLRDPVGMARFFCAISGYDPRVLSLKGGEPCGSFLMGILHRKLGTSLLCTNTIVLRGKKAALLVNRGGTHGEGKSAEEQANIVEAVVASRAGERRVAAVSCSVLLTPWGRCQGRA